MPFHSIEALIVDRASPLFQKRRFPSGTVRRLTGGGWGAFQIRTLGPRGRKSPSPRGNPW